jgi:hypothetical protein
VRYFTHLTEQFLDKFCVSAKFIRSDNALLFCPPHPNWIRFKRLFEVLNLKANAGNVDTWQSSGSGHNTHHSLQSVEPTQRLGDTKPLRSRPLKLHRDPLNSPQRPRRI